MTTRIVVRPTTRSGVPAWLALQRGVCPCIATWKSGQLQRQLEMFPQGQWVAVQNGKLLGCASSLVILWDEWAYEHTWMEITSIGTF